MLAAGLITLFLTPIFAFYGAHFGWAASTLENGLDLLLDDTALYISSANAQALNTITNQTFNIPWELSGTKLGAMLIGIIPATIFMIYAYSYSKNERTGEEHGSARWASRSEITKFGSWSNADEDNRILLTDKASMALSRTKRNLNYDRNCNVIVIGGSGSGKTQYYVKPNVLQLNSDYVITDPKEQLLPEVGSFLVDQGVNVRVFDTFNFDNSMIFNTFAYVKTDTQITEWSDHYFALQSDQKNSQDPFWDEAGKNLLNASIGFLRDFTSPEDYTLAGLLKLLKCLQVAEEDESFSSPYDLLFEQVMTGYRKEVRTVDVSSFKTTKGFAMQRSLAVANLDPYNYVESTLVDKNLNQPVFAYIRKDEQGNEIHGYDPDDYSIHAPGNYDITSTYCLRAYKKFKTGAGKTLKSVLTTLLAKFNAMETGGAMRILNGKDEMHLELLGEPGQKSALFLTFKDFNVETFGFLHGLLVWQALNVMGEKTVHKGGSKRLERPVNLILDEFRSLNLPKDISGLISVIRSRNIMMSIILQSYSQLKEIYDENTASAIYSNCDTTLFLGGHDEETTKKLSDRAGQQTITTTNTSSTRGASASSTESHQTQGRALIDQAEISKLKGDEAIVYIRGASPFKDKKIKTERHKRYEHIDPDHKPVWFVRMPYKANGRLQLPITFSKQEASIKPPIYRDSKHKKWQLRWPVKLPFKINLNWPLYHVKARYTEYFDIEKYIKRRKREEALERLTRAKKVISEQIDISETQKALKISKADRNKEKAKTRTKETK